MKIIVVLLILLLSITVFCKDEIIFPIYRPTKSIATSEANRASASETDAAFINPASLIMKGKKYIIDANWQYGNDFSPNYITTSIVDTKTSKLAGGASFKYFSKDIAIEGQEKDDNYVGMEFGLSYAYPISNSVVVGINGKYLDYDKNDDNYLRTATIDIGLLYYLSQNLKFTIVGYNLTPVDNLQAPLSVAFGLSFGDGKLFSIEVDAVADFTAPEKLNKDSTALFKYSGSVTLSPIDDLILMGGFLMDKIVEENFFSFGLQYVIPESRLGVVGGYIQSTSNDENKIISISLRLYL